MKNASQPRLMISLATDAWGGRFRVPLEKYLHFCTDLAVELEILEDDLAASRTAHDRRRHRERPLRMRREV